MDEGKIRLVIIINNINLKRSRHSTGFHAFQNLKWIKEKINEGKIGYRGNHVQGKLNKKEIE